MTPLEHLQAAMAAVPGPDESAVAAVTERSSSVLRPAGAFARLDEVAIWLGGWQRRPDPLVRQAAVVIFGGDHGVAAQGVSAYPAEVTVAMAGAITGGLATSSALAAAHGAPLHFVDVGVGQPTEDFSIGDAMDAERFAASWHVGREAIAGLDTDLLIIGELGIGNTTAAAAVAAGLFGGTAADWVGLGTGVDDDGLARKRTVVDAGLARVGSADPLEVLRCLGGTELVAMAGAATEARRRSIPVLLDGFIATSAMATIERAAPGALDHALAGHCSAEPGHRRLLAALGKQPLLDLDLRLGEASGALVALSVVTSAAAAVTNVATFADLEVTEPS
ncbi:MAG: nicotinate-nucleotide--dimethylbenzimidazole phosphoribosyltransferase [Acidimicrobiales bacterium]